MKKLYFEFFLVGVFIFFCFILLFFMDIWVRLMIKAILIYAEVLACNPYCRIFKTLHYQIFHLIGTYQLWIPLRQSTPNHRRKNCRPELLHPLTLVINLLEFFGRWEVSRHCQGRTAVIETFPYLDAGIDFKKVEGPCVIWRGWEIE